MNGFLDPVDFRGQLVTVGPTSVRLTAKSAMTPYKFMVMQVTGYKRWHLTQQVIMMRLSRLIHGFMATVVISPAGGYGDGLV